MMLVIDKIEKAYDKVYGDEYIKEIIVRDEETNAVRVFDTASIPKLFGIIEKNGL
jgi:hypothetical protein